MFPYYSSLLKVPSPDIVANETGTLDEIQATAQRLNKTVSILENASPKLQQWDEAVIRQLVDTVKVISAERIVVYLRGGAEIEQEIEE